MVLGDLSVKVMRPQRGCHPQILEERELCHLKPGWHQRVCQVLGKVQVRLVTTDPDRKESFGGPKFFGFPKIFRSLTTSSRRTRGREP